MAYLGGSGPPQDTGGVYALCISEDLGETQAVNVAETPEYPQNL